MIADCTESEEWEAASSTCHFETQEQGGARMVIPSIRDVELGGGEQPESLAATQSPVLSAGLHCEPYVNRARVKRCSCIAS